MTATQAAALSAEKKPIYETRLDDEQLNEIRKGIEKACEIGMEEITILFAVRNSVKDILKSDGYAMLSWNSPLMIRKYSSIYWGSRKEEFLRNTEDRTPTPKPPPLPWWKRLLNCVNLKK